MSSLAVADEGLRQTSGEGSQRTGLRGPSPTVVAIVLHRGVDTYLEQCLLSLYAQRTPLGAIVVAHDGSGEPPSWICQRFPNVALLTASAPARSAAVVDTIIKTMPADGYLFQEATDWSAPDRLERLVLTAQTSGAELVGSSYVVVGPRIPDAHTRAMPPDGNIAFQQNTGSTVVEPCTMLVDRGLVERLGGFNANLSVAAANEFVARAAVAARVVNVSSALYFHREHDASDWSNSATGGSLVARVVLAALRERSRHHAVLLAMSGRDAGSARRLGIDSDPSTIHRRHAIDIPDDGRNPYALSHDLVRRYSPHDARVCVVSKGDEMAVRIRGHSLGWHFPQTEDGTYAGHHPKDAREAIEHLGHLRDRGAQLFLIPEQYLWWLSHYTEFRQHLERSYVRVPSTEEEGALFDLRVERLAPQSVNSARRSGPSLARHVSSHRGQLE